MGLLQTGTTRLPSLAFRIADFASFGWSMFALRRKADDWVALVGRCRWLPIVRREVTRCQLDFASAFARRWLRRRRRSGTDCRICSASSRLDSSNPKPREPLKRKTLDTTAPRRDATRQWDLSRSPFASNCSRGCDRAGYSRRRCARAPCTAPRARWRAECRQGLRRRESIRGRD